jgi:5-formyltetrahydrofolate cyclo-ligase
MANQKFEPHLAIAALKQQWRHRLKQIRQELPANRQKQASTQACQWLSKQCQEKRFILSFASFGSEINLWTFNQRLAKEGRLVLPLIAAKELQLYQVTQMNQLKPHHWGMLEPIASICSPINISLIDIALIPGLGFDLKTKYRLGYGQGYYDRLLSQSFPTQMWGIGFLEQSVENLPYSKEDVPLHQVHLF